ncbi:hypothetical protein BD779DRAFT_1673988 [Infundibulicybe gibba]|nr:hypothetical protein BD779DRAFT_1673988 [Infundibulicybe gibba]
MATAESGSEGHLQTEEMIDRLDQYNISNLDPKKPLSQGQRTYFLTSALPRETLLSLNNAILSRNANRILFASKPECRTELLALGPEEATFFVPPRLPVTPQQPPRPPPRPPATLQGSGLVPPVNGSSGPGPGPNPAGVQGFAPPNVNVNPANLNSGAPQAHTSNPTSINDLISMLQNLSPTSQQRVLLSVAPKPAPLAPAFVLASGSAPQTSSVLPTLPVVSATNCFNTNLERSPSFNYADSYRQVPSQIKLLCSEGSYLPLTLFTNDSWKTMHTKGDSISYMKKTDISGTKAKTVMRTDQFGDEAALSQGLWGEAWTNYLTFLHSLQYPHAHARWTAHHKWITSQSDFHASFATYRLFDIAERQAYIHDPRAFSSESYNHKFQRLRLDVMAESLLPPPPATVEDSSRSFSQQAHAVVAGIDAMYDH